MPIDKKLLIEAISYRYIEFLEPKWESVAELIKENPFSEKMIYLLNNQWLSEKKVKNRAGTFSNPNCIGTAFFIAGACKNPYQAFENELSKHMKSGMEGKIPGSFVFSYCYEMDNFHAGIYLGTIKDTDIMFSQQGYGCKFGPETEGNYASPEYYLPSSLASPVTNLKLDKLMPFGQLR